jgi:hypothetical protein
MGHRIAIRFIDGPKDGVASHYIAAAGNNTARNGEVLPRVLVFQGLIGGRFQVLDYERVGATPTYRFKPHPGCP